MSTDQKTRCDCNFTDDELRKLIDRGIVPKTHEGVSVAQALAISVLELRAKLAKVHLQLGAIIHENRESLYNATVGRIAETLSADIREDQKETP